MSGNEVYSHQRYDRDHGRNLWAFNLKQWRCSKGATKNIQCRAFSIFRTRQTWQATSLWAVFQAPIMLLPYFPHRWPSQISSARCLLGLLAGRIMWDAIRKGTTVSWVASKKRLNSQHRRSLAFGLLSDDRGHLNALVVIFHGMLYTQWEAKSIRSPIYCHEWPLLLNQLNSIILPTKTSEI